MVILLLLLRYTINNPSKDRFLTSTLTLTKNTVTTTTTTHKERVANPIFEWNPLSLNQVGNKCIPLNYFDFGI